MDAITTTTHIEWPTGLCHQIQLSIRCKVNNLQCHGKPLTAFRASEAVYKTQPEPFLKKNKLNSKETNKIWIMKHPSEKVLNRPCRMRNRRARKLNWTADSSEVKARNKQITSSSYKINRNDLKSGRSHGMRTFQASTKTGVQMSMVRVIMPRSPQLPTHLLSTSPKLSLRGN